MEIKATEEKIKVQATLDDIDIILDKIEALMEPTGASPRTIKAVQLSGQGGAPVATNAMFSAAADAEGETAMRNVGSGWWRLLCQVTDGAGDTRLEYCTDEFKVKGGFTLTLR